MNPLQFPIGMYSPPVTIGAADVRSWIDEIGALPENLEEACRGLGEDALDTPYRDGGWTLRQVVHHIADSHMNSFIRFKLTLTEETPSIRPYFEDRWAELPDTKGAPIELTLPLIRGLHQRWVYLLTRIEGPDWARRYFHPEDGQEYRLDYAVGLYAWHGKHHVAHITSLRERMGWR